MLMLDGGGQGFRANRNGRSRRHEYHRTVLFSRTLFFIPSQPKDKAFSRCLEMFGSGRRVHTLRTRDSGLLLGWWASTTASSCAISGSCGAALVQPRAVISAPPTATFSRPMPDGNSAD